jgi:hypothetical protein
VDLRLLPPSSVSTSWAASWGGPAARVRGVWRRLDAAYYLATTKLALGMAASMLKKND